MSSTSTTGGRSWIPKPDISSEEGARGALQRGALQYTGALTLTRDLNVGPDLLARDTGLLISCRPSGLLHSVLAAVQGLHGAGPLSGQPFHLIPLCHWAQHESNGEVAIAHLMEYKHRTEWNGMEGEHKRRMSHCTVLLKDGRSQLCILPQEAVLFAGSGSLQSGPARPTRGQ